MLIFDILTISLGTFGYIQQYLLFRKERTTGGFSIYLTAPLAFASALKLLFYPIKPFGNALVLLNIMLLTLALLLTHKYVELNSHKYKPVDSFALRFWNWPTFYEYIRCMVYLALIVGFLVFFSLQNNMPVIGEILASLATAIQIPMAVPQILALWKSKSAEGVSKGMVGIWLVSDTYKTIYFIMKEQPLQFVAAGTCQALLDVVLIFQLYIYSKTTPRNVPKKGEEKKEQ